MNHPLQTQACLPVLTTCDVLVVGGTLTGISAALELARQGRKVVLMEARTYLGTDWFATLRPWVVLEENNQHTLLSACLTASRTAPCFGEQPLHPWAVKKLLEDQLLEAGVQLLYGCSLVSLIAPDGTIQGIVVGNKGGQQIITCQLLLDATPSAVIYPASRETGAADERVAVSLEFEGAAFFEINDHCEMPAFIEMPPSIGLLENRVTLHRGCRRSPAPYLRSHILAECRLQLPVAVTPLEQAARYYAARQLAIDTASHLLWQHPEFRLAYLGGVSEQIFSSVGDDSPNTRPSDRLEDYSTPIKHAWALAARSKLPGPNDSFTLGERIGRTIARLRLPPVSAVPVPPETEYPILAVADVVVSGGGTSGAMAAITASQEGAQTLLVEMNPGLGGTGTYGGVRAYWMGRRVGFSALSQQWTDSLHDRLRYPHMQGVLPLWNITAKAQALLEQAHDSGVQLVLNSQVVGVMKEADRVNGVLAATPWGTYRLLGKTVVDATGDGDLAAMAGARHHYGSRRDGIVMWYSLPQFKNPEQTQSNFTSMVDVSDPFDYTRGVVWGRRRGAGLHDHGTYLAPRESRHIHGDVIQTLADQLIGQAYPDVIHIAVGNNDMKGHTSSEWMKTGLLPPNLEIEISYRMLLPSNIHGMLVVGKAISAERDALPSIRFQPDLENLGGAAGLAAAMAARTGTDVRDIDIKALQARLVELGALPDYVLTRQLSAYSYTQGDINKLVEQVVTDPRPLWSQGNMRLDELQHGPVVFAELVCAGPQAVPLIVQALQAALPPASLHKLACALALMGSPQAVNVLVDELQTQLADQALPPMQAEITFARSLAPDHAAMPEAAYLLYALGFVADQRALPVWERVVSLLQHTQPDEVCQLNSGIFAYVDAVCAGAERLGDPAAVPILEHLLNCPAFHGHHWLKGIQVDTIPERLAYLELVIARALARCGSPKGAETLINYLPDLRVLFSRHAHHELVAIAGQDFGLEPAAWKSWLESLGEHFSPVPWRADLEASRAWNQTLYRSNR